MKILIVEDDPRVAKSLLKGLTKNGYAANLADTGEKAVDYLLFGEYDLVLLDLNLPDMDGLEICKIARKKYPALLILMLTAREKKSDIVAGLDCGADDYLVKPFHFEELLARIRALLRRDLRVREPVLLIQDLVLDTVEKVLWKNNRRVDFTKKEYGIIEYLICHPNELVSSETLVAHVWGSMTSVFTNTIRVHIQSIRRKIGDNPKEPIYIETVIGFGYRMIDPDRNSFCRN